MKLLSFTIALSTFLVLALSPSQTWAQELQQPPSPSPSPDLTPIQVQNCTGVPSILTTNARVDASTAVQFWNNSLLMYDSLTYSGKVMSLTCRSNGMQGHERTMQDCSQAALQLWGRVEAQTTAENQPVKVFVKERCYIQTGFIFLEWNKRR